MTKDTELELEKFIGNSIYTRLVSKPSQALIVANNFSVGYGVDMRCGTCTTLTPF